MPQLIGQCDHQFQTAVINRLKSPAQFGHKAFFSNHQTLPTESITLDSVQKNRETVPFILKNADPLMVSGATETYATISGPNIAIARPFTPTEILFGRHAGGPIFISSQDEQISEADRYMARELQIVADLITNTQEVLCWQMLNGAISYAVNDGSVFTLTAPRDSSLVINPGSGNYLDDTSPDVDPHPLIHSIKRAMEVLDGFQPTDVVMGSEAADAFLSNVFVKDTLDKFSNAGLGRVTLEENFREDGVMFLGRLYGLNWWEYSRTVSIAGVSTDLISKKYGHFIANTAGADRVEYFAAISDMDAFEARNMQTERFSKSWIQKMPSAVMNMTISRPFPWLRQPNAQATVQLAS